VDPLTVATKRFLRDLDRLWKRRALIGAGLGRIVARASDRAHLVKALRLAEHAPGNRWPLFLVEAPFDCEGPYFAALLERVLDDYALMREGAAEEGVTLAALELPARSSALPPAARAAFVLSAVAERLTAHLDGALVALLPEAIRDKAAYGHAIRAIEALAHGKRSPSLRVAVLDPEGALLEPALGPLHARFAFDIDELFAFAEQQAKLRNPGPPPSQPSPWPLPGEAVSLAEGHMLASNETAVAIQALFLTGARGAAHDDFGAAVLAYRRARDLCRDEGLRDHESAAAFALGGAYLAAGSRPMAQATFGEAALSAARAALWIVACQAKLGEAGVSWMQREFARAASAYAEAAALAERAESAPLHIEARRMEGLCHLRRGAEEEAILAFRMAIEAGNAAEAPARRASTFAEAVTMLAELLDERGLGPQAAHLRGLLEAPICAGVGARRC
jgi:tetratricopeptide (TPR) repeat protein